MTPPRFTGLTWRTCAILAYLTVGGIAAIGVCEAQGQQYQVPTTHRIEKAVNREWTFNYFPDPSADGAGCEAVGFDDSTWPAIAVPHTWQTYETTGKVHPFVYDASEKDDPYWWRGWGWYRKHFSIGKEQAGRKVFVEFDGVQKYSRIWVNGQSVGDHKGGYSGFYFDVTDLVRFGQDNVLAVAVNNRQNDPLRIPPMSAGNFDVYGGIYRDVRIVIKDRLHIPFQGSYRHQGGTFVSTPKVSEEAADVRIRTWVKNDSAGAKECELRTILVDAESNVVQRLTAKKTILPGELAEFDQTSQPIVHPHLWSPQTPYVYTVVSEVWDAGAAVDRFASPLGIREFKWDYENNRLILNGKKVIIHGSNRHQEYPWLGDATPKWLHLLDMRDFRLNLNHNFMRTAHYPQDPAIYDFCDRYGIIVIEEAPNIKRQKFSDEVQEQQLREMIRLDSVAIVRADIVDAEGNHVYGATNTIQWTVSGPTTLVGPAVYSTDTDKHEAMEGTMYIDAPTFNIIRSTGRPGEVKVRVLSAGIASAEVVVTATAASRDTSTAIVEPPLPEGRRRPVSREGVATQAGEPAAAEMKGVSEDLVQQWRKQICDNFFVPEPLPALEASTHRHFTPAPGVQAEGLTYRTQFGLLVPAILYLPDPMPAEKIPAFIVVNGHGGDKYSWYSYYAGILFARGGAAVLTYDQVGEGERNRLHKSGTRAHDSIKGDAMLARHLAGLMITDVRQAVSYLSQRAQVDERRIAVGGVLDGVVRARPGGGGGAAAARLRPGRRRQSRRPRRLLGHVKQADVPGAAVSVLEFSRRPSGGDLRPARLAGSDADLQWPG
jgi:hypothetical protein